MPDTDDVAAFGLIAVVAVICRFVLTVRRIPILVAIVTFATPFTASPLSAQLAKFDLGPMAGMALEDVADDDPALGYYVGVRARYLLSSTDRTSRFQVRTRGQVAYLKIPDFGAGTDLSYTQLAGALSLAWFDGKGGSFSGMLGPSLHFGNDCAECSGSQGGFIFGIAREWFSDSGTSFNIHLDFDIGGPRTPQGEKTVIARGGLGFSFRVGR